MPAGSVQTMADTADRRRLRSVAAGCLRTLPRTDHAVVRAFCRAIRRSRRHAGDFVPPAQRHGTVRRRPDRRLTGAYPDFKAVRSGGFLRAVSLARHGRTLPPVAATAQAAGYLPARRSAARHGQTWRPSAHRWNEKSRRPHRGNRRRSISQHGFTGRASPESWRC